MRFFIVGTGRCGTSTFWQACKHMTNHTCGHESAAGSLEFVTYPENHIEVDSHLSLRIPEIRSRYPSAKWVHLIRRRETCVESLAANCPVQLLSFANHWMESSSQDVLAIAGRFYDIMNDLIRATIPPNSIVVKLEHVAKDWRKVWRLLHAEGDFGASRSEWSRRYNSSQHRGRENWSH